MSKKPGHSAVAAAAYSVKKGVVIVSKIPASHENSSQSIPAKENNTSQLVHQPYTLLAKFLPDIFVPAILLLAFFKFCYATH